jgi:hypothetical protein
MKKWGIENNPSRGAFQGEMFAPLGGRIARVPIGRGNTNFLSVVYGQAWLKIAVCEDWVIFSWTFHLLSVTFIAVAR